MAYSLGGLTLTYMLNLGPSNWLLCTGIINVAFFAMEMRHMMCKDFNIIMGEFGPVEGNNIKKIKI
jgi:hypothetical protein